MANVVTTKVVTSQCKLILASGEFSSTIKTSQTIGSAGNPDTLYPTWNGNNTPAVFDNVGVTRSLKLYSGKFTSTVKTSLTVTDTYVDDNDISTDGYNTLTLRFYSGGGGDDRMYLKYYSGQFTTTQKAEASHYVACTDPCCSNIYSLSYGLTYTPYGAVTEFYPCTSCTTPFLGDSVRFFRVYSETPSFPFGTDDDSDVNSYSVVGAGTSPNLSYNATDCLGLKANKLYKYSGRITTTIKTSLAFGSSIHGLESDTPNRMDSFADGAFSFEDAFIIAGSSISYMVYKGNGALTFPEFGVWGGFPLSGDGDLSAPDAAVVGYGGGDCRVTFASFTVDGDGYTELLGVSSITAPAATVVGYGGGYGSVSFPSFDVAGESIVDNIGSGSIRCPLAVVKGTGVANLVGDVGAFTFEFGVSGEGRISPIGTLSIHFPNFVVSVIGKSGIIGSGIVSFPGAVMEATGYIRPVGAVSLAFPEFVLVADGYDEDRFDDYVLEYVR